MMSNMNADDLIKLLDSFSKKGGTSIKPQFEDGKTNFIVGNGETLTAGVKKSVEELSDYLVAEEQKNPDVFIPEDSANCASCANIPNMSAIDFDQE